MEQENKLPPKQSLQIFVEIAERQSQLMENITTAVRDINLLKQHFSLNKVRKVEDKLVSFREEVMQLELIFEQPRKYLQSYKEIEKVEKNASEVVHIEYSVLQMLSKGQLADRRVRIFTFLEHLEREISSKKTEIQFNRAMMVSLIAVVISVVSIIVSTLN